MLWCIATEVEHSLWYNACSIWWRTFCEVSPDILVFAKGRCVDEQLKSSEINWNQLTSIEINWRIVMIVICCCKHIRPCFTVAGVASGFHLEGIESRRPGYLEISWIREFLCRCSKISISAGCVMWFPWFPWFSSQTLAAQGRFHVKIWRCLEMSAVSHLRALTAAQPPGSQGGSAWIQQQKADENWWTLMSE